MQFARAGWLSIERFLNSVIQSVSSLARCRNILPPSSPRNNTAIAALLTSAFHVQDVRWSASPHLHLGPHIVSPRESISAHSTASVASSVDLMIGRYRLIDQKPPVSENPRINAKNTCKVGHYPTERGAARAPSPGGCRRVQREGWKRSSVLCGMSGGPCYAASPKLSCDGS